MQEVDFVCDLECAEIGQHQRCVGTEKRGKGCAYDDVGLDLGSDDGVLAYPISWG